MNKTNNELIVLTPHFEFTTNGLMVNGDPSFTEWSEIGGKITRIDKIVKWWIGDWLRYGEYRWGEMYTQAMDETGYAYETLRGAKWVADSIPPEQRHSALSFEHHKEVAAMPFEERERWLVRAEEEHLTVGELRILIRQERQKNGKEDVDIEIVAAMSEISVFRSRVGGMAKLIEKASLKGEELVKVRKVVEFLLNDIGKLLDVLYKEEE